MSYVPPRLRVTKHVPIPAEVAVGAVIGRGGSYQKALSGKYGIKSFVDSQKREVVLTGGRASVDDAMDELLGKFETLKVTKRPSPSPQKVHQNALKDGQKYCWRFKEVDGGDCSAGTSPSMLIRVPSESREEEHGEDQVHLMRTWVHCFDQAFVLHMASDMQEFLSEKGKVKAALGNMQFTVHKNLIGSTMTWHELQDLQPLRQIYPCWQNMCDPLSVGTSSLVSKLKDLANQHKSSPQGVLTVFLKRGDSRRIGVTSKFHHTGGHWVPKRAARDRNVHRLYNVGLDDNTAFRVRVISRSPATKTEYEDLPSKILIDMTDCHDLFSTKVALASDASRELEICEYNVKLKTHVDYEGLRFTLAHQRTDMRLECRLTAPSNSANPTLPEAIKTLVTTLTALLGHEVKRTGTAPQGPRFQPGDRTIFGWYGVCGPNALRSSRLWFRKALSYRTTSCTT